MNSGKAKCTYLRKIRNQVAKEYNLPTVPDTCEYEGDCIGTCPKCEEELRELTEAIERKRREGATPRDGSDGIFAFQDDKKPVPDAPVWDGGLEMDPDLDDLDDLDEDALDDPDELDELDGDNVFFETAGIPTAPPIDWDLLTW